MSGRSLWSFDGDALGEVAGLVDVAATLACDVVGQQLQGDDGQERLDDLGGVGDRQEDVGQLGDRLVSLGADGDDPPLAGADLLDVAQRLGVQGAAGATNTQGVSRSTRAIGPCFISAVGYPSAWM